MSNWIGKFVLLFALFGLVLTGCSNAPSTHTITGTVTEAGTAAGDTAGAPLRGVEVSVGSKSVTTTRTGAFRLENLPAGNVSVTFALEGYESWTEAVNLGADRELSVALEPSGGRLTVAGSTLANLAALNGSETDATKVAIAGNTGDLTGPPAGSSSAAVGTLTTAITVQKLQALVNGRVVVMDVDAGGGFSQDVPVDPGRNTIQLRVFDTDGNAYTSEPVNVLVTLDQLDIRVILNWDQGGGTDVDLHLFKRTADEPNPTGAEDLDSWWTRDRHVYYSNKAPDDFGVGSENPFLDIDDTQGFGPETIVLQEATPGYYHVWVHLYWLPDAVEQTTATVEVEINPAGSEFTTVQSFTKTLTEHKEYWYVTTVDWNSGSFIEVPPSN